MIHEIHKHVEDADIALELLKAGNKRYVEEQLAPKHGYQNDRDILLEGQKPFAAILCCSDSRVAPEIFFDQKLGGLFTIRNAGNIVDSTVLGSIEYAVVNLQTPLVVVCGHSHCGAVTAALSGKDLSPNIHSITKHMQAAIEPDADLNTVIRNNVEIMVQQIKSDKMIKQTNTLVVGAYYDIHTGHVHWM